MQARIWVPLFRWCRRRRAGGEGLSEAPNGDLRGGKEDVDLQLEEMARIQLPIVAYFGLILGYCALGGLLFTTVLDLRL